MGSCLRRFPTLEPGDNEIGSCTRSSSHSPQPLGWGTGATSKIETILMVSAIAAAAQTSATKYPLRCSHSCNTTACCPVKTRSCRFDSAV